MHSLLRTANADSDARYKYIPLGTLIDSGNDSKLSRTEEAYQIAVRLTKSEFRRIQDMIAAGIFRSSADFAREAIRDKLREAEPVSLREVSRADAERLIDRYLSKNRGSHFASEIAEELGLDLRTTVETIQHMINVGMIHKSKSQTN